jgi:trans-aconitate 2-methyltransferase
MADWNPEKYLSFANERAQPARDLIARLAGLQPQHVVDLGCGPGNSTALLKRAFPKAEVVGYDSSQAMIDKAKADLPGVQFINADVSNWLPSHDVDLVFSNALFQWVPQHAEVIARILSALKPGAVFAIQLPDNTREPSHVLMGKIAASGPWAKDLAEAGKARSHLLHVDEYHQLLHASCKKLEIWRTTYHHFLKGHQGIVDMISTTGLRPYLDPLHPEQKQAYLNAYTSALAHHYKALHDGTVLYPFPRLFITAVK